MKFNSLLDLIQHHKQNSISRSSRILLQEVRLRGNGQRGGGQPGPQSQGGPQHGGHGGPQQAQFKIQYAEEIFVNKILKIENLVEIEIPIKHRTFGQTSKF